MLPADRRVRRSADFSRVVRGGRRGSTPSLVVYTVSSDAGVQSRAGFIVGRAVGPAVVRNAVRRRLRHLMGDRLTGLGAGTDVVIRALPLSAQLTSAALGADLDRALGRALR